MTKAWLMFGAGFVLFCAGFPAMFDFPGHWWFAVFYVAGLATMILDRRRSDLLIYQRDHEKPVVDLEHQLAEQKRGAGLPPAQPVQQANAANETASGSRKIFTRAWFVMVFAIFCVVGGLNFFGIGALRAYEDSLGTPTTATIDHCVPHVVEELGRGPAHQEVDYQTCDGTWSVGGMSQTGQIRGKFHGDHLVGTRVDVHVRGGTAYQREPGSALNIWFMFGGFVAIATGAVLFWSVRRKNNAG